MRFHIHRWSRWRSNTIYLTQFGVPVGKVSGQLKICSKCGKEKLRRV